MKSRIAIQLGLALACALLVGMNRASADFQVYDLDVANTTGLGGPIYGTATVYDAAGANEAGLSSGQLKIVFQISPNTATTNDVGFNLKGDPTITNISITGNNPSSFTLAQPPNSSMSGFGKFDYEASTNGQTNNPTSVTVVFTTPGTATIDQFRQLSDGGTSEFFAAEYNPHFTPNTTGFVGGSTSELNIESTAVPAPPSAVIALTGLMAFGVVGLRRRLRRSRASVVVSCCQ